MGKQRVWLLTMKLGTPCAGEIHFPCQQDSLNQFSYLNIGFS
jgi:hypothetical protein